MNPFFDHQPASWSDACVRAADRRDQLVLREPRRQVLPSPVDDVHVAL